MKYAVILFKLIGSALAFIFSAGIAKYISVDLLGKHAISQTYFFCIFLPIVTLVWIKYENVKTKIARVALAAASSAVAIIVMSITSGRIAVSNPGLASQVFGAQIIVLGVIYAWLWGSLKGISGRAN